MRILLAEDDKITAGVVKTALESAGYVVDHEIDGRETWFKGELVYEGTEKVSF